MDDDRFTFAGETPEFTACFLAALTRPTDPTMTPAQVAEEAENLADAAVARIAQRATARAAAAEKERAAAETKVREQRYYTRGPEYDPGGRVWRVENIVGRIAFLTSSGSDTTYKASIIFLAAATVDQPDEENGFYPCDAPND